MILLLRVSVSLLRHAGVGDVFRFSFLIFLREESSFYNSLDLGYIVSPFMYSYSILYIYLFLFNPYL